MVVSTKSFFLAFLALFAPLTTLTSAQDFQAYCDNFTPCSTEKFLKCLNYTCECEDADNQVFDTVCGQCVIISGRSCSPEISTDIPICVQGAECNPLTNLCECSAGYYETELNICAYRIGKACGMDEDCDAKSGLQCQAGLCLCPNSSFVWQQDFGCVMMNFDKEIAKDKVTPTSTTTTTTALPIESMQVSTSTNGNDVEDLIEEYVNSTGTATLNPNATESHGSEIGDRYIFPTSTSRNNLVNLVNQIIPPILNPLHPNNPLNQIGINRPSSIFQGITPKPKPNKNAVVQSIQANGQNKNKPTSSSSIYNPPPIPQTLENPSPRPLTPADLFGLRKLFFPIQRILFPRLSQQQGSETEVPSPIWLLTSSINQLLPVLRAIDHQLSPVLQNLAALTKPKYWDGFVQQVRAQNQQRQRENSQVYGRAENVGDVVTRAQNQIRNPFFPFFRPGQWLRNMRQKRNSH